MKYQISINENLQRIFSTKKHQFPLNPNYGLNYEWIDKPITSQTKQSITDEIITQINLFEPRLNVESIQINQNDSKLSIIINTLYKIEL